MRIARTKNTIKGSFWGIVYRLTCTIIPFIIRTIIIKQFGEEYVGLNSLFTSILQVLSLSELGLSSAIVFSMYKPIANDDYDSICCLLNFYRKAYLIIGSIILSIGLLCLPFLPYLINGDVPEGINVYFLYIIFLSNTCISYFFFGYKEAVLTAYQRNDILSTVRLIVIVFQYAIQIIVLLLIKNFYLYVSIMVIFTFFRGLTNSLIVNKKYPHIKCCGKVPDSEKTIIKKNMAGVAVGKVGVVARGACDNIIISAFLSLTALAIFDNYYYILSAVIAFLTVIENSLIAGVGNSIVIDNKEKQFRDFKKISLAFIILSSVCVSCLACLYQPFMMLWVGDSLMLVDYEMILFCLYFYVSTMSTIGSVYLTAGGLWWKLKMKSIIEVVFNLSMNILLVYLLGIVGILIATICSLFFFSFVWSGAVLFKNVFPDHKLGKYILTHLLFLCLSASLAFLSSFICNFIEADNSILLLAIRLLIAVAIPLLVLPVFLFKTEEFKSIIGRFKKPFIKKV